MTGPINDQALSNIINNLSGNKPQNANEAIAQQNARRQKVFVAAIPKNYVSKVEYAEMTDVVNQLVAQVNALTATVKKLSPPAPLPPKKK